MVVIKPTAKEIFRTAAMLSFYNKQKIALTPAYLPRVYYHIIF
jgi:hypothetical protein